MDYNYTYANVLTVSTLSPLSASVTGKIYVVASQDYSNVTMPKSSQIKDGVEIRIVEKDDDNKDVEWGSVKTKDGAFTFEKLPAGKTFYFIINTFTQDDYTYAASKSITTTLYYDTDGGLAPLNNTLDETGNQVQATGGYLNLGQIYLFALNDVTFVTEAKIGTKAAPIPVNGASAKVEFTFSKAIDPTTVLGIEWNDGKLIPTLSTDNKTLTLTPSIETMRFPYSEVSGITNSDSPLDLSGIKAVDGSSVYPNKFDVYTTPKLALVSWEIVAAASVPARSVAIDNGGAVKLTFNKEISPDPAYIRAEIDSDSINAFKAVGADLYIYHDGKSTLTDEKVSYAVVAKADLSDTLGELTADGDLMELEVGLVTGSTLSINAVNNAVLPGNNGAVAIKQYDDIVIELEQDYGTTNPFTKVEFSYTKDSSYSRLIPTTAGSAPITWDNLRRLTIAPANWLAEVDGTDSSNFAVKLYYTENGKAIAKTIRFKVSAPTDDDVPAKTAKTAGTVTLTPTTGTGANTTALTLTLTPTSVAFEQEYDLDYKIFEGRYKPVQDNNSDDVTISVLKGSAAAVASTDISSGLTSPLVSGEVRYRVSGVDTYGFYLETVTAFTFP
jgi:hypothetical protein